MLLCQSLFNAHHWNQPVIIPSTEALPYFSSPCVISWAFSKLYSSCAWNTEFIALKMFFSHNNSKHYFLFCPVSIQRFFWLCYSNQKTLLLSRKSAESQTIYRHLTFIGKMSDLLFHSHHFTVLSNGAIKWQITLVHSSHAQNPTYTSSQLALLFILPNNLRPTANCQALPKGWTVNNKGHNINPCESALISFHLKSDNLHLSVPHSFMRRTY